jgi:hypothetical protein
MEFHDYEPHLIIVASLIKLCDFLFHHTPKLLLVLQRRLRRKAAHQTARIARRKVRSGPDTPVADATRAPSRPRRRRRAGEQSS